MRIWVITDDKAGTRNQCVGLAARLDGRPPDIFTSRPRFPWSILPARWWPAPLSSQRPGGAGLAPPWPDVAIVAGRGAAALGPAVRAQSQGRTLTVAVQDPKAPLSGYDLVAAPAHDGLSGPNVLSVDGALTRVTPALVAAAVESEGARWRERLAPGGRPLLAVLLGGPTKRRRFGEHWAEALGAAVAAAAVERGARVAATASRRTPSEALDAFRRGVSGGLDGSLSGGDVWIWDGAGDNPYMAMLGLAERVVATGDSVSMLSDVAAAGVPLVIADPPGGPDKFTRFHEALSRRTRAALWREGRLPPPPSERPAPLDETGRVVAAVQALLAARITPPDANRDANREANRDANRAAAG